MPALPQYQYGAVREGLGNIEGLMSLRQKADRMKAEKEENAYRSWEREIQRPVVELRAKVQVGAMAATIADQQFDEEQKLAASHDYVEALGEYKAIVADPIRTPREKMADFVQNYGSYGAIKGPYQQKFRAMTEEVTHHANTQMGREDMTREQEAKQQRDHTERQVKAMNDRQADVKMLDDGLEVGSKVLGIPKEQIEVGKVYTKNGQSYMVKLPPGLAGSLVQAPAAELPKLKHFANLVRNGAITPADESFMKGTIDAAVRFATTRSADGKLTAAEWQKINEQVREYGALTQTPYDSPEWRALRGEAEAGGAAPVAGQWGAKYAPWTGQAVPPPRTTTR